MRHWERLASLFKHDAEELDPKAFIREFRLLVWEGVGVGHPWDEEHDHDHDHESVQEHS